MSKALAQSVNVIKDIIPAGRPNRPGTKIRVTHITVHNTSNTNAGADAKAHSKFLKNKGYYDVGTGKEKKKHYVSWHFTVDDGVVYQHLPIDEKGWHAGGGNSKSLGIEICMNSGIDQGAANLKAAILIAGLLNDLSIKAEKVVPHSDWTGKNCPIILLNRGSKGSKWNSFIELISKMVEELDSKKISLVDDDEFEAVAAARGTIKPSVDPDDKGREIDHDLLVIPDRFLTKHAK